MRNQSSIVRWCGRRWIISPLEDWPEAGVTPESIYEELWNSRGPLTAIGVEDYWRETLMKRMPNGANRIQTIQTIQSASSSLKALTMTTIPAFPVKMQDGRGIWLDQRGVPQVVLRISPVRREGRHICCSKAVGIDERWMKGDGWDEEEFISCSSDDIYFLPFVCYSITRTEMILVPNLFAFRFSSIEISIFPSIKLARAALWKRRKEKCWNPEWQPWNDEGVSESITTSLCI